MKFRKTVTIGADIDKRGDKKASRVGHMRVTIPIEIREKIDLKKGDFIEWEVDTVKNTLVGKLLK